ncbi:hypothetical protein [Brassicibacter mesophilus]|uniref:hypothetical protein n=1 Tax=Brassicibacter mesophilus TaxID=745119 RepID=UPI003D25E43E
MRKSKNEVAQYLTDNYKENKTYVINQLKKIPSIINTLTELNDEELYKISIPQEYMKQLKNGSSHLKQSKNGNFYPTITDTVTGKFKKHVELEKLDKNFIGSTEKLITQQYLADIIMELETINEKLSRVLIGQQNDRIGLALSAKQQFIEVMNIIDDEQLKRIGLMNTIKTANDARGQLIENFKEDLNFIREIPNSDENLKLLTKHIGTKDYKGEIKSRILGLHKAFESINMISGIIAFAYQELNQSQNIEISFTPYKELLSNITREKELLEKLYDYDSRSEVANVWIEKPKQVLNNITTSHTAIKTISDTDISIEFYKKDLIEEVLENGE